MEKERTGVYQELIVKEMQDKVHAIHGITTFYIVLREHLYSDIPVERNIAPMNHHMITQQELVKHLKMVKKNKATCLDNIKGELYRALGESTICVKKHYKKYSRI